MYVSIFAESFIVSDVMSLDEEGDVGGVLISTPSGGGGLIAKSLATRGYLSRKH